MEILIGVILVLGGLLMMVGGIWLLVMAFKESLVWGFCCLFLQIAQPIFICTHWDRSWPVLFVRFMRNGNYLSRWLNLTLEVARLKMPSAALPGAKLLKVWQTGIGKQVLARDFGLTPNQRRM